MKTASHLIKQDEKNSLIIAFHIHVYIPIIPKKLNDASI